MPPLNVPPIPPVPAVIPAAQYPHLKALIKELDFPCATCSAKVGSPVFHTFEEAVKEPLSAPSIKGKPMITKMGMYATRFAIFCPETRIPPNGGPFIQGQGIIDLLAIPPDYKRPQRASNQAAAGGISYDDAEALQAAATPAVRMPSGPPKGGKKKKSDLNTGKLDKAAKAKKKSEGEVA